MKRNILSLDVYKRQVLDWARTDLAHENPNGANNLYMNWGEFAYFDIYIPVSYTHLRQRCRRYCPSSCPESQSAGSRS